MNYAAQPFDGAGLVAMSACGHWWAYPWRMSLAQLHDVVAFHRVTACPFCETIQENRRSSMARPTIGRLN